MFVGLFCCIYCCFLMNKYFSCDEQTLHAWSICCLEPNSVLLSYHPAHKGTPPSKRRGIYTKQKALKFETPRLLRYGRDSNPRPPAWQAGILTSWTTTPFRVALLRLRCKGSYFFGICNTCRQVFYCFFINFLLMYSFWAFYYIGFGLYMDFWFLMSQIERNIKLFAWIFLYLVINGYLCSLKNESIVNCCIELTLI